MEIINNLKNPTTQSHNSPSISPLNQDAILSHVTEEIKEQVVEKPKKVERPKDTVKRE